MPDDFDTDSLSKYLHLTPAQVSRMADRGRLPGRKIAGQWRFSQAEIHHWLEDQIGASDDEELDKVDKVLDAGRGPEVDLSLETLIPGSGVAVPLRARTRGSVIAAMTELAAKTGLLWDAPKMEQAVREREELHPTALDNGVALLHPRRPLSAILAEPLLVFGRTTGGIPFGGARGILTDLFFLICSTDDRGHLRALARISRLINDPEFLPGLREAVDARAARNWIVQRENELNL